MDLLTKDDLARLITSEDDRLRVSLFIPTHRIAAGVEEDRIKWKKLLLLVEETLRQQGMRPTEIQRMLSHAWEIHEDAIFWQHLGDGLAYFVDETTHELFRVPIPLPEIAAVGNRFVVGPLTRLMAAENKFLLLSVTQNRVRLFEGSRYAVAEVELHDIPQSIEEVRDTDVPRTEAMARPTTTRAGGARAVYYGHGGYDDEVKKTQAEQFLRQVDTGLERQLSGRRDPMVLAGVDHVTAMFREISLYPHILPETLEGNYDRAMPGELHELAWPLVRGTLGEAAKRDAGRFGELHGTGFATNDLPAIVQAAEEGRVDTLFLSAGPSCWERRNDRDSVVLLGADPETSQCEALDQAAVNTLTRSGTLHVVAGEEVPGGADWAAILRY